MKTILIALLLTIPAASYAATSEPAYLAARDAAIRKIEQIQKRKGSEDAQMKLHDAALADLEKRIRPVVGPSEIKGFPADGRINLTALSKGDMGYGTLDGLVYRSTDERTSVTVTTETLLKAWLKAHRNWWRDLENVPQDVAKALRSNAFHTQALDSDAAFSQVTELPIAKPASGIAVALLGYRAQDVGPSAADLIIVAAVRGGRVFVVSAPASAKVENMPPCQPIWDDSVRKVAELFKRWEEGGRKKDKAFDQSRMENEADAAYRKCFGERVKADPRFRTLTEQAQALLDALPSN